MSRSVCLASLFSLVWIIGCGKTPAPVTPPVTPPPMPPAVTEKTNDPGNTAVVTPAPTDGNTPTPGTPDPTTPPVKPTPEKTQPTGPSQVLFPSRLVTDGIIAAVISHPRQVAQSALIQGLQAEGVLQEAQMDEALGMFASPTGQPAKDIAELAILVDKNAVKGLGAGFGLPMMDDGDGSEAPVSLDVRTNLKQIGLAFHNYHDIYGTLPRASGEGGTLVEEKQGLSWRVHLLPLMDQAQLYLQFKLDEPWDSEHNKQFIEQMPAVFQVKGVDEPGKTSIHIFTSAGTPFADRAASKFVDFTDGMSNTLLCVAAGADTADIWTKPGGLTVDPEQPLACLGKLEGDTFLGLLGDGSVQKLPTEIDPKNFANLVTFADGNPVQLELSKQPRAPFDLQGMPPDEAPAVILTMANDMNPQEVAERLLGDVIEKTHAGQAYFASEPWGVAFPNARQLVFARESLLQEMLANTGATASGKVAAQLEAASQPFDALLAIDLTSQKKLLASLAQGNPFLGPVANIETLSLTGSVSGKTGDSLLALYGTTVNPQAAQTIAGMVNGLALNQLKTLVAQAADTTELSPEQQQLRDMLQPQLEKLEMKVDGQSLSLQLAIPEGFDGVAKLVAPEFKRMQEAQERVARSNRLKHFGLAFHNYHDVQSSFPRAGGAGGELDEKRQGLSWRVHLLPYLDQAPLYNQFHLDEPWDSDHNKTLIELMPDIFKCEGVDDPTKTSIHVFIGKGTPFADQAAPRVANFTDGTSNTILAVEAGPDTADVWTKPGGLDFDPEAPFKSLGEIGETFQVLLGDGAVRRVSKSLDPKVLSRLIQHADGEVVEFP